MRSLSKIFLQRLILSIVGAIVIYLLFGPLALTAATSAIVLRKGLENKYLKNLLDEAIEAKDKKTLIKLEKQQIFLKDNQKLAMLINAYNNQNDAAVNWLARQNFKINFDTVFYLFNSNQEIELLKLLIERFLDKQTLPEQDTLAKVVNYLYVSKAYQLIDILFAYYPRELLTTVFNFFNFESPNYKDAYNFLNSKKAWLITNQQIVNDALVSSIKETEQLLYFLIDIFPDGTLDIGDILIQFINRQEVDQQLCKFLIDYFNKAEKNNKFYRQFDLLIETALSHNHLKVAEYVLQNNPNFLNLRKDLGTKLLFQFSHNPTITELLLMYGADVNSTRADGLSLLEKGIGSRFISVQKKQQMLNIYMKYGIKFDHRLKDAPQNRSDMTLLSYLPFLNLKVNDKAFQAIKLQKFIALFLEIPGISFSNGTVCKHTDMQDSQAFWNFLIDLYFNCFKLTQTQNLPDPVIKEFNTCLNSLYTEEGDYDTDKLYKDYSQGKPIILPVYIQDGWGGLHIAVTGFMKNGPNTHLVVEADRGLGRHDFSVFEEKQFNFDKFCQYTNTHLRPIFVTRWQTHTTKPLLLINLEAQKDNFCPSISAKFAIHITIFLCIIYQKIKLNSDSSSKKEELLTTSYQEAIGWLNTFFNVAQEQMLDDYRNLEAEFIDRNFLSLVEEKLAKATLPEIINESEQLVLSNSFAL
ncbi:hypothetical protein ACQUW5_03240 [Legionella sp. CNM-1927-20]|uniref:hypothetical protein n=1 Tax=Legionella sp. CNM-1927-20 TaxID=3422221 RepID=UPI00403AFE97